MIKGLKDRLGDKYLFRGIQGRTENVVLYKMTFRHLKIPIYKVNRLYSQPYSRSFEEIFFEEKID